MRAEVARISGDATPPECWNDGSPCDRRPARRRWQRNIGCAALPSRDFQGFIGHEAAVRCGHGLGGHAFAQTPYVVHLLVPHADERPRHAAGAAWWRPGAAPGARRPAAANGPAPSGRTGLVARANAARLSRYQRHQRQSRAIPSSGLIPCFSCIGPGVARHPRGADDAFMAARVCPRQVHAGKECT